MALLLAGKAAAEVVVGGNVDQSAFSGCRTRTANPCRPTATDRTNLLADDRLVLGVEDRPAGLRHRCSCTDIWFRRTAGRRVIDAVSACVQHPQVAVARRMDERVLNVWPFRCMSISTGGRTSSQSHESFQWYWWIGLDLAGVGIQPEHGAGVEIVAGMQVARPRCGVADAPIDGLGVLVVVSRSSRPIRRRVFQSSPSRCQAGFVRGPGW